MISWRGICWDICLTFKLCVHTPRRSIFINIWTWFMTRGQNGKIYSLTRRLGFARYTTCALTPSHLALCNIYNTQMYKIHKIYSLIQRLGFAWHPSWAFTHLAGAFLSIFVHWRQKGQIYIAVTQRLGFARHPSCAFTPRHLALRNITNLRGQLQRQVFYLINHLYIWFFFLLLFLHLLAPWGEHCVSWQANAHTINMPFATNHEQGA